MATKTYTSVYGGLTLEAVCTYTENVANNSSTVSVTLNLKHGEFYASALSGSYLSVAGVKKNYTKNISWSGGNTTTALTSQTVTVAHNAEGVGTCRIIGTFILNGSYGSTSIGTMTIDQTLTLTKIPRASALSAPASITTGSTMAVTITPANSAFKHKLQYKVGATVFHTSEYLPSTTTSYSYTIDHSWLSTAESSTLVVLLSTYTSAGVEVGSVYKLVSLSVPSTIKPSIASFTASSSVTTGTFANLYVQGKTSVILSATASAGAGASIVSYTYSGPNVSSVITSSSTSSSCTTGTLQSSGSLKYTVTVKDSRGRTATGEVTISSQPYTTPKISYVAVQRCDVNGNLSDSGTYAKYTVNSTYSTVNGKNTRTVTVAYSSNGGTSYSAETTLQAATDTAGSKTGTYGGGVFALASAYIIRFTIKDLYDATHIATAPLQSAARPININSTGKGVAIGGMSTKNAFECSMDADFNKAVNVDGVVNARSSMTVDNTLTVGSTLTANGAINPKQSIYMGGLNGQTGELQVVFSNPAGSANRHSSYLYGGSPSSPTAIGCFDGLNGRIIWNYNDVYNTVNIGSSDADIYFKGVEMVDFVTSYGSSAPSTGGEWMWRKWKSGRVEAVFERSLGTLSLTTKSADGVYTGTGSSGTITYPTNLFTKAPLVFHTLQSSGYTTMICASVTKTDCMYRIWSPHSAAPTCSFVLYFVGWHI